MLPNAELKVENRPAEEKGDGSGFGVAASIRQHTQPCAVLSIASLARSRRCGIVKQVLMIINWNRSAVPAPFRPLRFIAAIALYNCVAIYRGRQDNLTGEGGPPLSLKSLPLRTSHHRF